MKSCICLLKDILLISITTMGSNCMEPPFFLTPTRTHTLESNGLRNREVVRQYRKRKHIELMEYTEKSSGEPGRFGELMCLLTPLFEVSMEVTEQLRLEQFVHEGEARIDALLLMSMINGAEETTESVADT